MNNLNNNSPKNDNNKYMFLQFQQQLETIQKNYFKQNTTQMIIFVLSISVASAFNSLVSSIIDIYPSKKHKIFLQSFIFLLLFSLTIIISTYLELNIK